MRFSRSTFTEATLDGCVAAKAAKVRVAAKRRVAFGDDKKSWRTGMKVRLGTQSKAWEITHLRLPA